MFTLAEVHFNYYPVETSYHRHYSLTPLKCNPVEDSIPYEKNTIFIG